MMCTTLNFVTARLGSDWLIGGPNSFKETFGTEFHGIRDFGWRVGRIFEDDAGFRSPGQKKADGPAARHVMWPKQSERVGVARGEQRVNAGIQISARLPFIRCGGNGERLEIFGRQRWTLRR